VGFFGRKLEGIRGRSRERTPEGSKASKRAKRPRAGEPEGLLCRSSRSSCGATRAVDRRSSRSRGNHVPASSVSNACPLHGGLRARLGRGAWWKPVGQPGNLRAGDTVDVEPARKQKAAERRHGSPGRESSEGRIPGTFVVGQPAAKAQGRSDDGTAGAGKLELAGVGAAQTAEGQRKPGREHREHQEHRKVSWVSWVSSVEWTKPEGGTGRGCGNPRLPRSVEPIVAETGHPESNVVGTKNPRRGGPEHRRKPAIRRRRPLGQCTPVVL
jgi:hypothetical protein